MGRHHSDEQKRALVAEYDCLPQTRAAEHVVIRRGWLERHGIAYCTMSSWRRTYKPSPPKVNGHQAGGEDSSSDLLLGWLIAAEEDGVVDIESANSLFAHAARYLARRPK